MFSWVAIRLQKKENNGLGFSEQNYSYNLTTNKDKDPVILEHFGNLIYSYSIHVSQN